ncbi:MAG: fructose-6-phosphate aldolase [bacterium]|nr:fructose-6-phosphate aldolase [bacterium]
MKLFLDTADINEIRKANSLGILDGVTTNPTLIAKTGMKFLDCIKKILEEVKQDVSIEVGAVDYDNIVKEARFLSSLGSNVVVKIPMIADGVKAINTLVKEGIKINVTLVFQTNQALIAAKCGAKYVSPFIGRFDDISEEGIKLIEEIKKIYTNYGFKTQILVASVRNPIHVKIASLIGADVCTMPYSVFEQLIKHPLTDIGLKRFLEDWSKVPEKPF